MNELQKNKKEKRTFPLVVIFTIKPIYNSGIPNLRSKSTSSLINEESPSGEISA